MVFHAADTARKRSREEGVCQGITNTATTLMLFLTWKFRVRTVQGHHLTFVPLSTVQM